MQPIARYYSSRANPMPANVEDWIERLPMAQKIALASALLNQYDRVLQTSCKVTEFRKDRERDHAS